MIKNLPTAHQLALLKDQTKRTGLMHEAQVVNLKWWGILLSPDGATVQVAWDTETSIMKYIIDLSKAQDVDGLTPVARDALESWVKELLGENWALKVEYKR